MNPWLGAPIGTSIAGVFTFTDKGLEITRPAFLLSLGVNYTATESGGAFCNPGQEPVVISILSNGVTTNMPIQSGQCYLVEFGDVVTGGGGEVGGGGLK